MVAAGFFVGVAANENELAVGGGIGQSGIADSLEIEAASEAAIDERDERLFEDGFGALLGRVGDERGVVSARVA